MKGKMVFGALMLSVALSAQGFGYDLLDRVRGLNGCGGCGGCQACAAPAACAPAAKCETCEPCNPCARRCDLFRGLKDLFACHRCGRVNCCCEPACKPCEQPAACAKPAACEAPCAAPCAPRIRRPILCRTAACETPCAAPAEKACGECAGPCRCGRRIGHGLILGCLRGLFSCNRCDVGCESGCGEAGCGGAPAAPGAPAGAPTTAPSKPGEEAAPLPIQPKADPSASLMRPRTIYQASRIVAQN